MKNKIERNNLFSSKSGYPQFLIVFGFILLITFFSVGNLRAQCSGKSLTYSSISEPCNGNSLGSASVTFVGGTSQYSYSWSKGGVSVSTSPTSTITGLSAGSYTVVVQDNSSCQLTQVITITEPPALTGSAGVRLNVSCYGGNNGEATVSGSGGTKPYTFIWSNGAVGDTARNLVASCYTITVKDAKGCSVQLAGAAGVCITEPSQVSVAPSFNPVACNGGNTGSANVSVTGGTYPFAFTWSNGYTNSNTNGSAVSNLTAKVYTVTITDAKACVKTQTITVTEPAKITGTFTVIQESCGPNKGIAKVNASGGTGALTYSWWIGPGVFGQQQSGLTVGSYTVHVIDANGCQISVYGNILSLCDSIWPGDADRDLVTDNNDILAIGIGYGSTGSVRSNATINWMAQVATDWGTTLSNGKDYKNVDCNGDGTINANDTTAIIKNYGLTHALKLAQPEYINGLPDLTFKIPNDTTLSGSNIKVPIMFGTSTNQATGVYGLAFSITYDPKIVDTTKLSLSLNGSWLGTNGTNLIYMTKNFGKMGRMDVGITRIDHQNVSGFGKIGDLNIYMRDDISGKIASTLYKKLMLQAVQVKAISKDESIIQLNAGKDSIIVEQGITTGINRYNSGIEVKIYPNPASGSFTVDINGSDVKEIQLVNIIGETVWQQNNNPGNKIVVDTQLLSAGTYYLSITTSQERIVKQVNIIK